MAQRVRSRLLFVLVNRSSRSGRAICAAGDLEHVEEDQLLGLRVGQCGETFGANNKLFFV